MTPLTLAITMSILYIFIFEAERIRLRIITPDNVEYLACYKKNKIFMYIAIILTFLQMVCIGTANYISSLYEDFNQ